MKKNKRLVAKLLLALVTVTLSLSSVTAFALTTGAQSAKEETDLNLEKMLKYAIEDEYLAKTTYGLVIEKFNVTRPFSNIEKAEEMHIKWLKDLYNKLNMPIAPDNSKDFASVPETLELTFLEEIKAEEENIAMYERFLKENIPEDVKVVFEMLLNGSKNHLIAFQRGVDKTDTNGNSRSQLGVGQRRNLNSNRNIFDFEDSELSCHFRSKDVGRGFGISSNTSVSGKNINMGKMMKRNFAGRGRQ